MSVYLDTLLDGLLGGKLERCCAIEHGIKRGWFMFDVDRVEGKTEIIWIKDPLTCLRFASEEKVEEFLANLNMPLHTEKHNAVDIRKL